MEQRREWTPRANRVFAQALGMVLLVFAATVGMNALLRQWESTYSVDLEQFVRLAQHMHWATVAIYLTAIAYTVSLYVSKPTEKYLLYFGVYAMMMCAWALLIKTTRTVWLLVWIERVLYIFIAVFGMKLCHRLTQAALPKALRWVEGVQFYAVSVVFVGIYILSNEIQSDVFKAFAMLLPLMLSVYMLSCAVAQKRRGAVVLLVAMAILTGLRPSVMSGTFMFVFRAESAIMRVFRNGMRVHELMFVLAAMLYVNREFAWQFAEKERLAAHLDELVQERTKKLLDAQQQRQSMMMNIFHDVRTPLAVMRGALDTMQANPAASDKMLPLISSRLDFVAELTGDLFLAAKLEDGQVLITCSRVDLSDTVREQGEQARQLAQKAGVALHAQVEPGIVVWGERLRLAQIVQNLLTNAIHYTPAGGTVALALACEGGEAVLSVSDSGKGISPEDQPHIFDRYFHTTAENKHESSGLGLTIARDLTLLHRGTLSVQSEAGRGTTFYARFAMLKEEEKEHA